MRKFSPESMQICEKMALLDEQWFFAAGTNALSKNNDGRPHPTLATDNEAATKSICMQMVRYSLRGKPAPTSMAAVWRKYIKKS